MVKPQNNLVKAVTKFTVPTDDELKAKPEDVAYAFYMEVKNSSAFDKTHVWELNAGLQKWLEAESVIYAIVVSTLENVPQYIIDVGGAGRAQLDHLVKVHRSSTKTPQTRCKEYSNVSDTSGTTSGRVSHYHQRLLTFVKEMSQDKNKTHPANPKRQRNTRYLPRRIDPLLYV